jgi:deazaflavin-dependent oxidoreductase (nitroreductase family)
MPLPHWLGRVNRSLTNHVTRPVAGHAPGFGIVVHRGRRSGRSYSTPVNVFAREGGFAVALTYGPDSQWVRNVLAAGRAEIVTRGHNHAVVAPRVVQDTAREHVPPPVRPILRALDVDRFLLVDVAGADEDVQKTSPAGESGS